MSIEDFVNDLKNGDNVSAQKNFDAVMGQKITDALDAKKIELASKMVNKTQETDSEE